MSGFASMNSHKDNDLGASGRGTNTEAVFAEENGITAKKQDNRKV